MNRLLKGWRYAAVCALLVGLPVAAACSQPATGNSENDQTDGAELEILFPEMYSAFDGEHPMRVPAMVKGVKNVKWSADPEDAVDLEKQADGSVMITVKEATDVTIIAKAGSITGKAPLHVTKATPDEWEEGNQRYNNGVVFKRGEKGDGGGGGWGKGDGGPQGERFQNKSLSCINCHNRGGSKGDVEHTPMQTAGYSDEELIKIFSEGKKPEGVKMRTTTAKKWERMHKWSMEENEKKGLVVYLRALEPEEQGEVDFGGRGGHGKGKGGDDADDKPSSKE